MSDKNNTNLSSVFEALRIMQREGILHGISWHTYTIEGAAPDDPASELHIGSLKNFRVHLSTGADTNTYFMQLREMIVVPEYDETNGITAAVPQYVILIPNTTIVADDLDEAKCVAIGKVMEYISAVYKAATERYEHMVGLFGDLNKILREKTAKSRACEPIELLGLSGRALKNLQDAGVRLIGELVGKTRAEIKSIPGIGGDSLNNILTCLHKANLGLKDETSDSITTTDLAAANNAGKAAATAEPTRDDTGTSDSEPDTNSDTGDASDNDDGQAK